jgi:hypothetical protein
MKLHPQRGRLGTAGKGTLDCRSNTTKRVILIRTYPDIFEWPKLPGWILRLVRSCEARGLFASHSRFEAVSLAWRVFAKVVQKQDFLRCVFVTFDKLLDRTKTLPLMVEERTLTLGLRSTSLFLVDFQERSDLPGLPHSNRMLTHFRK